MANPVPLPPPGFDDLSIEEQIECVQSLWDRIAAPASREIRESNQETRRLMRVLHEEKLARLADLQERWWPRRRKR